MNKPETADNNNDSFKIVTSKKSLRGKKTNTTISAVKNRKWIFVSNLNNTTTEKDLENYLKENNFAALECHRLLIRTQEIAAFKIAISEEVYDDMFQEDLWPLNVIVRPFKNFRARASILRNN